MIHAILPSRGMGKVPAYAIDKETGHRYTASKWRSLTPKVRKNITAKNRTYVLRKPAGQAENSGPAPLDPPESWTGSPEDWVNLPSRKRQLIRKKAAKRVYTDDITQCPILNLAGLREYLDWDLDPVPQVTEQLLTWDGRTKYYRNYGRGRRYGDPYVTLTSANRGARGICCHGTCMRDGDLENCQPTVAANFGVSFNMTRIQLQPLLKYVAQRDFCLDEVRHITGCCRDEAKNLFITCLYAGNEWGWMRRLWIQENEVCAKLSAYIKGFRTCMHAIRALALEKVEQKFKSDIGSEDADTIWHYVLTEPEDRALTCILECMKERGCRIAQLSYDGVFWMPSQGQSDSWSATDDAALEAFIDDRLKQLPGLGHFPLRFKIKQFQQPKIVGVITGMRERIQQLELENERLRAGRA